MDSWPGVQMQNLLFVNLSYFIFPQRGAVSSDWLQEGEKRKKTELELKNFILQGL